MDNCGTEHVNVIIIIIIIIIIITIVIIKPANMSRGDRDFVAAALWRGSGGVAPRCTLMPGRGGLLVVNYTTKHSHLRRYDYRPHHGWVALNEVRPFNASQ